MDNIKKVFDNTNWALLKEQKKDILSAIVHFSEYSIDTTYLNGLLNWLDSLIDAAELDGYPVQFLTEES